MRLFRLIEYAVQADEEQARRAVREEFHAYIAEAVRRRALVSLSEYAAGPASAPAAEPPG